MKKCLAMLLCLSLSVSLCGCSLPFLIAEKQQEVTITPGVITGDKDEMPSVDDSLLEGTNEPAEDGPVLDSVELSFHRDDRSLRNEQGQVLIEVAYTRAQVDTDCAAAPVINAALQEKSERFFLGEGDPEAMRPLLEDPYLTPEYPYMNTVETRVTQNGDGLLSLQFVTSWYMGGVYNALFLGSTYRLSDGAELSLTDLLPGFGEEAVLQLMKGVIRAHMDKEPDMYFEDAAETVEGYTLSSLHFYVENGRIWLVIPEYDLAPGVAGPIFIDTGYDTAVR